MPVKSRFQQVYDDMFGTIRSALGGATQWVEEVITGTTFVVGALRNNSNDMVQLFIEPEHEFVTNAVVGDLHAHIILQAAASGANQTILFTGSYAWIKNGEAMPATAGWTALPNPMTITLTGTPAVRTYLIVTLVTGTITPPVDGGYGSVLCIILTRGNGTYTGNIGIFNIACHALKDRNGSTNLASD